MDSRPSEVAESPGAAALQVGLRWGILMSQAQGGEAASYRRLLIEITPYLRALARRYHRDVRDVEDSVQDVLLTVHTIRHTYDPARPFKPWLVAIARRRIADRLRTQWRTCARESQINDALYETFADERANPHEEPPDERVLRAAIEQLPSAQRQAVTLLKMEEMSLQEAARASGQSVSALKVATHRAIKSLRRMLSAERNEP
ncbi:MAG: sigma-70 family RNA polymerase sigma factor [Steroidobacteraceae bacterium]|jgi:RNA polymerase sigma-70 factor (ECF subfamily)